MERKLFQVGNVLVNDGGNEVVVYEVTESFVFVAPFFKEGGKVHIITQKTVVYQNDESKDALEPVYSISVPDPTAKEESAEEPAAPVNEKVAAWTEA